MKTFLETVAEDILNKYGNNLANVTVLFPNKRASLFMNEAFAEISTQPVLTPRYKTIRELFLGDSGKKVADSIELVCLLYSVYKEVTGSDETLDHFFSWGEIMIRDFDDIDKHLLDAHQIFANVKDLHELDDNSFLTDEQKDVIRNFFPDFEGNNNKLKENFLKLWSKLADIYDAFNRVLDAQQKYYEGALYRRIVEGSASLNEPEMKTLLIVGFNHILPVEKKLFSILEQYIKVEYYWDELPQLPGTTQVLPNGEDLGGAPLSILSSTTNDIQARYVAQWLNDKEKGRNTVIVLADENLLPAVLHNLPADIGKVNITIGHKLAFTFIPLFLYNKMKEKGFADPALTITQKIDFLIDSLLKENSPETALDQESVYRTYTMLNRLKDLSERGVLDINDYTFKRLLNQLLNSISVPFHGEPLEGVQIMGVLETRNLDFRNVLMLSCNEGTLPKCNNQTSFIPYFLRKAHNLSTLDTQVDIYAYYFYRLLKRAENVTFCWNKSTDGMQRGEMSRFLLQLKEESGLPIKELPLQTDSIAPALMTKKPIEKTDETIQKLRQWFTGHVSPTAINTYLRCQKQFYYKYVLGLKEYEDEEDINDDNRTFGNVFHHTVEELYKGFVGREVTTLALHNIRDEKRIKSLVEHFYRKELSAHSQQSTATFDGLQSIKINVLTRYVLRLIDIDLRLAPFTLLGLEKPVSTSLSVQTNGEKLTTEFGGYIDRLDMIKYNEEEVIRVVDYKTGKPMLEQKIASIEEVFNPAHIDKHSDYYQQAIGYSAILASSTDSKLSTDPKLYTLNSKLIYPSLLFIQHSADEDYDPILKFKGQERQDVRVYQDDYWEGLQKLLVEIFDPQTAFSPHQRTNSRTCEFCPFAKLCLG